MEEGSYPPPAEVSSVYSTALANWARNFLPLIFFDRIIKKELLL